MTLNPEHPRKAGEEFGVALQPQDTGPERGINGGIGAPPDGYNGHVTFYIHVNDVPAALEKIESLGGTTMMPPQQLPDMVIALFKDPQGHTIGLVNPQM